ncbi:Piso0_005793 [Millerozyma farinosa CBS 7064]|uniref:Piso0_005793 protein n=1 Tax=Pichia sorbitophila (strain ATCC MYA-4447 / BCRC 22081 / CBS 7064 / NBRC 10061 / NRRL Y-12695) TaxID=559304 RepID=G8XZZ1_PICSO|nr:Piso0_005793 [Millerozyma farinosa CBS 7064]
MSTEANAADLQQKVESLSELVSKQSKMIAKTGEEVMKLQLKGLREQVPQSSSGGAGSKVDMDDYATNEDLVQLVGELQNQLDYLEERNVRRIVNSQLHTKGDGAIIAPLPSKDGEEPPEDVFPKTLSEFKKISKYEAIMLCEFYDIWSFDTASDEALNAKDLSIEDTKKFLAGASNKTIDEKVKELSDKDFDDVFDHLARYLGVPVRKHDNVW